MNLMLIDQLKQLRLSGLKDELERQQQHVNHYQDLAFEARLSLLLNHELTQREQRRVERLVKQAKFRLSAQMEQTDYRPERQLNKNQMRALMEGEWLRQKQNLLITGATGCGKTYIACALGHHVCQQGIGVRYFRLKTLLEQLQIVHAVGTYPRLLNQLNQTPLLIIDDWAMEPITPQQRSDLLDIIDARYQAASTIVSSQLSIKHWHELIGESTYADAIMDRLLHHAQRLELEGESMRKMNNHLTQTDNVS